MPKSFLVCAHTQEGAGTELVAEGQTPEDTLETIVTRGFGHHGEGPQTRSFGMISSPSWHPHPVQLLSRGTRVIWVKG